MKRHFPYTKNKRGEVGVVDTWLVPYGNLVTVMMILFLILWAFAYFSKENMTHYEKVINSIQKSMGAKIEKSEKEIELTENMNAYFKDKGLSSVAQVNMSAQQIKIVLRTPVLFDLGAADLKPDIYPALDEIAYFAREIPGQIIIEGHTDNLPISGGKYKSNFSLSAARAFNVVKYLIEKGVSQDKLSILGYGEYRPIFPNDTEANRSLNRRIEINIVRTEA